VFSLSGTERQVNQAVIDHLCSYRRIFSITCARNNGIDRKFPEVVAFNAWRYYQSEGIYLMEKLRILILFVIAAPFGASAMVGCGQGVAVQDPPVNANRGKAQPKKTLRAFSSEQELTAYFRQIAEESKRKLRRAAGGGGAPAAAIPEPAAESAQASADAKAKGENEESVTNAQHAGVDEGGIVKLHGDHLVVLRRGRLFTVAVGDGALKPVSAVDAFGPGIDPRNTWYDEMLISGDRVVVIGYSYERGGTEIGLFDIDREGHLEYSATYHLRSNDYYSSRNYSSRLIGDKLVFYTPFYVWPGSEDPFKSFPSLRKWRKGADESEFKRIVSASHVYRPERKQSFRSGMALHTVTVCDLARSDFACEAAAVLGPPGRVFYVSPNSVYVWTTDWSFYEAQSRPSSMLYRMPLDGSAPSALGVSGSPVDQFSFLESVDDHINVLVRSAAAGDGMWSAEVAAGEVALMRAPLANFSDGGETAQAANYARLPKPEGYAFQNRFVGDYLLYGSGSGWGSPENAKQPSLYVTRWAGGAPTELSLQHGVDRIETMGSGAVIVGADQNDLHFTSVRLGELPAVVGGYTQKGASQGELRSHGFFYKPEGPDSGLLGLPISGSGRPGYLHLFDGSASVLFLRNDMLRLKEIGALASQAKGSANDGCRASCVDWYGNARPLFLRGRIFALLGYEIVEGTLTEGHVRETRRINYAPHHRRLSNRSASGD
jgi:Beta propeller domain